MLLLIRYKFEKENKTRNHVAQVSSIRFAIEQVKALTEDLSHDFPQQVEKLGDIIVIDAYCITDEQKLPEHWNNN